MIQNQPPSLLPGTALQSAGCCYMNNYEILTSPIGIAYTVHSEILPIPLFPVAPQSAVSVFFSALAVLDLLFLYP